MSLTQPQVDIIRDYLSDGMEPEAIARSLQRMADLPDSQMFEIRAIAEDLHAGRPLPEGLH